MIITKSGIYMPVTVRVPAETKLQALQCGINLTAACNEGIRNAVEQHEKRTLSNE